MAEPKPSTSLETSKSAIPSNEELIDSLVSGLEKSIIDDESENDSNLPNSTNRHSASKASENDFIKITNSESELTDQEEDSPDALSDKEKGIPSLEDDLVDELALKDLELTYTEEDRERLHKEAEDFKQSGNELFRSAQYHGSILTYTKALRTCPLKYAKDRAIYYSNRAAAKMKLELNESAIEDCTKALELDEKYLKALYRRAQLYEVTDKLDEALADYNRVLEIDPLHKDALYASKRLPDQIQERNEKLKTEMLELPQENKQPATTRSITFVGLCGVVVVLFASIYHISNPKGEPEVDVKQFEQTPAEELFDAKFYRLEDVYRTQEPELWWTLAAGIKSTLKHPIHPSVFLMLYDSESAGITAKCLAKDVSKPTTKFLMNQVKEPIIINGVKLRKKDLIKDSGLLVEELNITVRDTGVLIVLDLHEVPAKVAESFHYICDRFSPLVDKAVLFFTLKVNAFSASTLVKTAEERLKQLWSNNMEDYKMHPLITRMTPNVVKVMNDFSTC